MSVSLLRWIGAVAVLVAVLALSSCSSSVSAGSERIDIHWTAAKNFFYAGEYTKSLQRLDQLMNSDNEYTARAIPMSLLISSGVADGYMELAEYYTAGARANKTQAVEFRRKASDYRSQAAHMVLEFAENTRKMEGIKGSVINLAFPPASGSAALPPSFKKIASGIQLSQADEDMTVKSALQRSVLLAVCRSAGAPNDPAKMHEVLQRGTLLPRQTFMGGIAEALKNEAQLFSRNKLDEPAKMQTLQQLAQTMNAAAGLPPMVIEVSGDGKTGKKNRSLSAAVPH